MMSSILFVLLLSAGIWFFTKSVRRISRNIRLGRDLLINDRKGERWSQMIRVALGQSKMVSRPVAGFFHIIIYAGFIIINIEVLEIIIDGVFGTHRIFAQPLGSLYDFLIGSFEILAFLVILACVVFFARRSIIKLKRFTSPELDGFPNNDALIILGTEVLLMSLFLFMNASDQLLQQRGHEHYVVAGYFPVSSYLTPLLEGLSVSNLVAIERVCWWLHIAGILAFLNYVPFSKHFHIFLSFPNVWYSKLDSKGKFSNNETVTNEVRLMMDPAAAAPPSTDAPTPFGAKDVRDLTWKNLMDAYSCTECGRCTSSCPANITGKKLSPRKIMMDTRDRLEEVGRNLDLQGPEYDDGKSLLGGYISPEELWACTTCNACVEACPVNIDPLSIIVEMRRYMVMEQSSAPTELNGMFTKIENNGAPWQFSQADRMNWTSEG
ncbi:MAG: 4Fe-4S dicluster domain-containing protein [Bacteroidota bacterium]|jgi:heterodisulfide reductase subunit C